MGDVYNRLIKYHYYKVVLEKVDDKGKWFISTPFLISDWLGKQVANGIIKKNVDLSDCTAYIEKFFKEKNEDFYSIRFYKLRETNIPSKIKVGNEAEPIDLDEDEYIGEDMNLLYDRNLGVCMIQSNRMSIGVKRIAEWMSKDCEQGSRVSFLPIYGKTSAAFLRKKKVRTIDISFGNIKESESNQSLGDIIRGVKKFDGLTGHITISVGRKRNSELSIQNTTELIEELDGNRDGIKSAKIRMKDDENGRMEIVDLFEDVLHDYIPFEIEVKKNLDFDEEHRAMLSCYKNRIEEIKKFIK